MAFIQCAFHSAILEKEVHADVILPAFSQTDHMITPAEEKFSANRKFPTLTLLHGFSQNETSWQRFTSLERYAERYQLAVICPDGNNGHYTDWDCGPKNLTFLQEEFLPAMRAMFPLSADREDNFVGGLSMGGYGAFKWCFTYPETFSRVLNFSGGLDVRPRMEYYKNRLDNRQVKQVYGENLDAVPDGPHDVFWLIRQVKASGRPFPKIFTACGTEDVAGSYSQEGLLRTLEEIGEVPARYSAPGHHDFWFWDEALKKAITEWLPLKDRWEGLDLP